MGTSYIIDVRRLPIGEDLPVVSELLGLAGHLYIDIWKPDGTLYKQINGLATDTDNNPKYAGWYNDTIKGYLSKTPNFGGATQAENPHAGKVVFSGTKAQVDSAIGAAAKAIEWINDQNYTYDLFGQLGYNSNSVFSAVMDAMQTAIPISETLVQAASSLGVINPGVNQKILTSDVWKSEPLPSGAFDAYIPFAPEAENLPKTFTGNANSLLLSRSYTNGVAEYVWRTADDLIVTQTGYFDASKKLVLLEYEKQAVSHDAVVTETYTHFDASGKPIGQPDIDLTFKSQVYQGEVLGDIFGSQLGALVAGDNVFAQVAGATVGATLVGNIAEYGQSLLAELGCWILSKIHYNRGLRFVVEAVY